MHNAITIYPNFGFDNISAIYLPVALSCDLALPRRGSTFPLGLAVSAVLAGDLAAPAVLAGGAGAWPGSTLRGTATASEGGAGGKHIHTHIHTCMHTHTCKCPAVHTQWCRRHAPGKSDFEHSEQIPTIADMMHWAGALKVVTAMINCRHGAEGLRFQTRRSMQQGWSSQKTGRCASIRAIKLLQGAHTSNDTCM
jgi:hypothetical protein